MGFRRTGGARLGGSRARLNFALRACKGSESEKLLSLRIALDFPTYPWMH